MMCMLFALVFKWQEGSGVQGQLEGFREDNVSGIGGRGV